MFVTLRLLVAIIIITCLSMVSSADLTKDSSHEVVPQKMKLTIAIMLPQDYIRLRNFKVCIDKEINKINKGNWAFTKHFFLDRFDI